MSIINLVSPGCRECISNLDLQNQGLTKQGLHLRSENNRNIYFAPVGNQFNFGHFNDGITPKVVIMGITTSPTARDQFLIDLKSLQGSYNLSEAFKRSCIQNIFNS